MREVYLAGEDEVTKAIIRRTLAEYAPNLRVKNELPARGGELKKKIENFNNLSSKVPVILLTDLDAENCAPTAKERLLDGIKQEDHFIVNIAVDEAEAWLMADREGFAKYLGVAVEKIPSSELQKQGGRKPLKEMKIPLKASYFLTHTLAFESNKKDIRERVGTSGKNCKGKEYNTTLVPFIEKDWNVETAKENSDSLRRMIERLRKLNDTCVE